MDLKFLALTTIGIVIVSIIRRTIRNKNSYQIQNIDLPGLLSELHLQARKKHVKFYKITFGDFFIRYSKFPKINFMYCEAIGNAFLKNENHLTKEQENQMKALKFFAPYEKDEEGNFSKNFFKIYNLETTEDWESMFQEMEVVISSIYAHKVPNAIQLEIN